MGFEPYLVPLRVKQPPEWPTIFAMHRRNAQNSGRQHLGRVLDLSFFEILKPWREDADHVGARGDIQVTSCGVPGGAERTGERRCAGKGPPCGSDHGGELRYTPVRASRHGRSAGAVTSP